jgi:hypothetical protein
MLIAIVNHSARVTDADANLMTLAVQQQLTLHVAPAWNQKAPTLKFYSAADIKKVPGYAWIVGIFDNPTVANALGYHSENDDVIDGFTFVDPVLDNKGVVLYDESNPQNVSVSSVLSHEVVEMFGDRFANLWADGPANGRNSQYAMELCDPVEADSYVVEVIFEGATTKVSVSNFVFPSWFNPQATVKLNFPFDYLKKLTAPFTMTSGGYMIVRVAGNASQIFGYHRYHGNNQNERMIIDPAMPEWKRAFKKSEWYRR